jgi:pantoate ligase/cytidylate kinase
MGSLHQGHQSLIRRAQLRSAGRNGRILVSVFVNPLQFGPGEDLQRYPRDLSHDAKLAATSGAHALFAPRATDLFAGDAPWITRVQPPSALERQLCGLSRPGHFEGVATVVCRLLALIQPQHLYLGEKDWQQLVILRRVLGDLGYPVKVEACPTVRETDGLACSSRNRYLSAAERLQAAHLPRCLASVRDAHRGAHSSSSAASFIDPVLSQCRKAGLAVDYVQLVDAHTLQPRKTLQGLCVLAAAVGCGSSRLIDHVFLMNRSPIVAIDGPAGAGKSTVTRAFADRLGLLYLDSGAMYRAVTWWMGHRGVDPSDSPAVETLMHGLSLQLSQEPGGAQVVLVNGNDVSEAIRSPSVTSQVSVVAALPSVREALTAQQQAMGRRGGLVAEGRDIGTAVFPEADCKVFLTASVAERARRRAQDLTNKGFPVPSLADLENQISERDHRDSTREVAPLRQAEDAVELVTDGMSIDEVVQELVDLFRARIPEDAWPDPASLGVGQDRTIA